MSILIDSSFFIALLNTRDNKNAIAIQIVRNMKTSYDGNRYTFDYILDEVITGIWKFTRKKDLVIKCYELIVNNPKFVILSFFPHEKLNLAWEKWKSYSEYPKRPLSFTDATILTLMEVNGFDYLLTFDKEFEGLVPLLEY